MRNFLDLASVPPADWTDEERYAYAVVDKPCPVCGVIVETRRIWPAHLCPKCRSEAEDARSRREAKARWLALTERYPSLRDADPNKATEWEAPVYKEIRPWDGKQSFFFCGPSGHGKTFCAAMLLKFPMAAGLSAGLMLPEDLAKAKDGRHNRTTMLQQWTAPAALIMDDTLTTDGAATDARVISFVKDLVDYRLRHQKGAIMTSQISLDDYLAQSKKWANPEPGDQAMLEAVVRRIGSWTRKDF